MSRSASHGRHATRTGWVRQRFMNRAVRNLIRVIAAALVVIGGLLLGLQFIQHRTRGVEFSLSQMLLGAGLIIGGIVLLIVSAKLAKKLTEDFEE
jgi:hypothetical protein